MPLFSVRGRGRAVALAVAFDILYGIFLYFSSVPKVKQVGKMTVSGIGFDPPKRCSSIGGPWETEKKVWGFYV